MYPSFKYENRWGKSLNHVDIVGDQNCCGLINGTYPAEIRPIIRQLQGKKIGRGLINGTNPVKIRPILSEI